MKTQSYLLFVVHDKTYDKHGVLIDERFEQEELYLHIQIFPIIKENIFKHYSMNKIRRGIFIYQYL